MATRSVLQRDDAAVRRNYANRTAAITSQRTSRGAGREDVLENASSVLPSASEFSQAILQGEVDPIGVLTNGRQSIPVAEVLNAQLKEAKATEQSALNKVNDYMFNHFGSLDLRDPAELEALNAQASEATQKREAIQTQVEALEYAEKYSQKTYQDNFFGQTGASYTLGRINQDSALAWNEYIKNPTAENKEKARQIDTTLQQFQRNNAQTLDEDATLPWISQSVASQIPQTLDQLKYGAIGAAGGAVVGSAVPVVGTLTGAKLGYTAGSSKYAYDTMRGAAFRDLLAMGADEETARAAAKDEAVLNALIEAGDTGVDIATLGAGTSAKQLGKALLGYGINVGAEGGQEGLQQSVSIANRRRALEGETGLWNLTKGSAKVLWDSLTGKDSEAAGQMKEAGKEGMKVAAVLGGATRVATLPFASTTNTVFSSAPTLTENEISVMQKQLADMQFQKRLNELAAVYEKNVGPIEEVSNLDEPIMVGYDKLNEGLEGYLPGGEKAKPASIKLVVRDSKFEDFEGNVDWETWAPNGGRVPGTVQEGQILEMGTVIDRYGHPGGRYASPVGVSYEQRALPYVQDSNIYHQYEVIKPINNVTTSKIAEAFEQPGGGIQYELPLKISQLIEEGYLKEIKK